MYHSWPLEQSGECRPLHSYLLIFQFPANWFYLKIVYILGKRRKMPSITGGNLNKESWTSSPDIINIETRSLCSEWLSTYRYGITIKHFFVSNISNTFYTLKNIETHPLWTCWVAFCTLHPGRHISGFNIVIIHMVHFPQWWHYGACQPLLRGLE